MSQSVVLILRGETGLPDILSTLRSCGIPVQATSRGEELQVIDERRQEYVRIEELERRMMLDEYEGIPRTKDLGECRFYSCTFSDLQLLNTCIFCLTRQHTLLLDLCQDEFLYDGKEYEAILASNPDWDWRGSSSGGKH